MDEGAVRFSTRPDDNGTEFFVVPFHCLRRAPATFHCTVLQPGRDHRTATRRAADHAEWRVFEIVRRPVISQHCRYFTD
jgi:hypothetical protein